MKHKYKGLQENPVIIIEKKIYEYQKTKKIKKILQNAWLFRGHPFVLHKVWCSSVNKRHWSPENENDPKAQF